MGLQSQISCDTKASSRFLSGMNLASDILRLAWPHAVTGRARPTQGVSNERNREPQGKYEHQVIWPPADSLSIVMWLSESKAALTRDERLLSLGAAPHVGNNPARCSGAHSKAQQARQQFIFLFLWFFLLLHANNLLSSASAACHPLSPGELSGLASTRPSVRPSTLPCTGLIQPQTTNYSFSHLMRKKPIKNWLDI